MRDLKSNKILKPLFNLLLERWVNLRQRKSIFLKILWKKSRKKIQKAFSHRMSFNNKRCNQVSLI